MDNIFLEVKLMAMDQAAAAVQQLYNNSPEITTVTDSDSLRRNVMDSNNEEVRVLFL